MRGLGWMVLGCWGVRVVGSSVLWLRSGVGSFSVLGSKDLDVCGLTFLGTGWNGETTRC